MKFLITICDIYYYFQIITIRYFYYYDDCYYNYYYLFTIIINFKKIIVTHVNYSKINKLYARK